ncbi:MAG: Type I restriction-modification system, DNA-methyltransferase subunit M (EC [uncultured Sulfurovum sp.]|uniref:Type I restriction-modification system, DNA-methyltransferase subunit M (EC) n=1 Tax=uncultured Sulfurovum sp. TaxID=269237 RepID=A0A6S6SC68_9BACT|nr:MAG: Type I restriction-modification system, DNA-methyltransferase subunit M (EC [uncultured Sulfurovum sp.]
MPCQVKIKDKKIYAPLKNKWLVLKPEEEVRQKYICRLVQSYGYSLDQMQQEVQVNNSSRGQGRAMADILIWKSKDDKNEENSPLIVVECKAEYLTIREEDYFQGSNYASWAGADFFVTTNLKETKIFQVVKGKIPKRLKEIIDIPNFNIVNNDKKIEELLKQTKSFTRDEFSKLLTKCHNIIRNNDRLSPEAAFDEISKILFIKIRYERSNNKTQLFSLNEFIKEKNKYIDNFKKEIQNKIEWEEEHKEEYIKVGDFEKAKSVDKKVLELKQLQIPSYIDKIFDETKKEFKNDDLFNEHEKMRIKEGSFEAIVEELQKYNLSITSDDVKGIAFEQFLGKTFRGELGQFFTPRTVVDFMNDILDPREGEIICDPCCGSGGFLIKSFEYVRSQIEEDIQKEKETIKKKFYDEEYDKLNDKEKAKIDKKVNNFFAKLNGELDKNIENSRLKELSYNCIYGTDANPRMSRTAKMNMIMHGDGHGGVHHNDGLLNVNGIFENRFDVILTNPPFGSRIEKSLKITEEDRLTDNNRIAIYQERYGKETYDDAQSQINDNINKSLLSLYDTGKLSTLTEVLFIERCLNLLKAGGRMGIVLPEGVLNNSNLQKVRDYVESKAKIILITSIPQDVFIASGATVKPSLLFFKKFTEEEAKEYETIKNEATKTINSKFEEQLEEIEKQLSKKGKEALMADEKKKLRKDKKELEAKRTVEIKVEVKETFNYEIPIAEIEKAGISTTGAKIENELIPLEKEFKIYREKNRLWESKKFNLEYKVNDNNIVKILNDEELSI